MFKRGDKPLTAIYPGGINRGPILVGGTTKDTTEPADLHSALEGPAAQEPSKARYALLIDYEAPSRDQFMIIRCASDDDHTIVARASIDEEARMIVKALNAPSKTEADIGAAVEKALRGLGLDELEGKSPWACFLMARLACISEWDREGQTPEQILETLTPDLMQIKLLIMTAREARERGDSSRP